MVLLVLITGISGQKCNGSLLLDPRISTMLLQSQGALLLTVSCGFDKQETK